MDLIPPNEAERVEHILDLFAHEARIERSLLKLDAQPDELGIASLDLAVALFEMEEHFGVVLAPPPAGAPPPTVGDIVQQVLAELERRPGTT